MNPPMSLRVAVVFLAVSLPCASHGTRTVAHANSTIPRHHSLVHHHSKHAQQPPPQPEVRISELSNVSAAGLAGAGAGQEDAKGTIEVNGPLPIDFKERFTQAVAKAAKIPTSEVHVLETKPYDGDDGLYEITFTAPEDAVSSIMDQAADPDSDLANSALHWYLLEKDEGTEDEEVGTGRATAPAKSGWDSEDGIDVDTDMPFGELAPFGREDTAKELTEQSVDESNEMVDQFERAEVAEEKRSVFRALTRLRGAAITSFDGIARAQTGNIDQYNAVNKWRDTHPIQHLAQEESDISKWAFPSRSD